MLITQHDFASAESVVSAAPACGWAFLSSPVKTKRLRRISPSTRILGRDASHTLETMYYFGGPLCVVGDFEAGMRLSATNLHSAHGCDHKWTMVATSCIGRYLLRQQDDHEAKVWLDRCYQMRKRVYGEEYFGTIVANQNLAKCYLALGQCALATSGCVRLEPSNSGDRKPHNHVAFAPVCVAKASTTAWSRA
ncbi:Aste57867_17505 [Aphanomyces stellatus]|uniref:Aste57867_17505 protein n=1 Tax=Aphanomyces stellatus TaxID=120398 RepID=A0A485L8S6_9STRA|nr:hypothetical protein As57867_017445 [Aphanomyces stellatus]VFT94258.1 Aste57867_17505 [Aphanomyces stellatus]